MEDNIEKPDQNEFFASWTDTRTGEPFNPTLEGKESFTRDDVKALMELARRPLVKNLAEIQALLNMAKDSIEKLNKVHEAKISELKAEIERLKKVEGLVE